MLLSFFHRFQGLSQTHPNQHGYAHTHNGAQVPGAIPRFQPYYSHQNGPQQPYGCAQFNPTLLKESHPANIQNGMYTALILQLHECSHRHII